MKYLGIDYGKKRVGVALSDETGSFAFPKEVIPTGDALSRIRDIALRERVAAVVIGDARSFSGISNVVTDERDKFAVRLQEILSVPIETVWEAGSSVEASRFAPEGRGHDDAAAAAIILQRFLDAKGRPSDRPQGQK